MNLYIYSSNTGCQPFSLDNWNIQYKINSPLTTLVHWSVNNGVKRFILFQGFGPIWNKAVKYMIFCSNKSYWDKYQDFPLYFFLSTYNILETYWAVFNNTLAVRYINKHHITFLSVPFLKLFMTIPWSNSLLLVRCQAFQWF